jgi:hypothetical protein
LRAAVLASLAAAACLASPAGLRAIVLDVTQDQAYRAIAIGRGTQAERTRFHAAYLITSSDPTIERVELVTPFRRVVLETERRLDFGDHQFGARQAADAIKKWRSTLTISVRIRFHPQNVYVTVPPYETIVASSPGGDEVRLGDVRRTPLWARPDPNQRTGTGTALVGAIIESDFAAAAVGQATRVVSVMLDGKPLARATIDFAKLD